MTSYGILFVWNHDSAPPRRTTVRGIFSHGPAAAPAGPGTVTSAQAPFPPSKAGFPEGGTLDTRTSIMPPADAGSYII